MTSADAQTGFRSRSRQAIEAFLQSVVVLDDRPEMPTSHGPVADSATVSLTEPGYPQSTTPADPATDRDPAGGPLDAAAVIAGFADIGSVCAVLSAARSPEFRARAVKAARRADIVVLDWTIEGTVGDEALAILQEILKSDDQGQRLRLIAVYTQGPDLNTIRDRVQGAIDPFHEGHDVKLDGFRLSKGPLHIVVLAKEGIASSSPELGIPTATDGGLANRLVEEFALMTGGLLWNAAIAGIATVRDNAHRILAKFEKGLDPAYLGHRLMLPHPPDAQEHVEEALGAEIVSVIEEHQPGSHANLEAIGAWLTLREAEGLRLSEPFSFESSRDSVDAWCELLLGGVDAPGVALPPNVGKAALRKRATEPFVGDQEAAKRSDRGFAALLSLKTRYPGRVPRLTIGTVLRTGEPNEREYFLCLQPKCDSVRLDTLTGFPLAPLIPLETAEVGGSGEDLRLIVEPEPDQWEHFGIETKPSDLTIRFFEPNSTQRGGEVLASRDGVGFYFADDHGKQYWWIAEMKDEHALRVAGEVASALARPGPNDSEWLRRARGPRE
ncbi:MAG: response regulator receiver domain [Chloroflexi bacterium]|nr:response regulator receiver domain [Chloroflexota bacterium]